MNQFRWIVIVGIWVSHVRIKPFPSWYFETENFAIDLCPSSFGPECEHFTDFYSQIEALS